MRKFNETEKAGWNALRTAYAERLVMERAVRSTTIEEVGETKARANAVVLATKDVKRLIAAMETAKMKIVDITQEDLGL